MLCKQQPLSDTVTVVIIWGWGGHVSFGSKRQGQNDHLFSKKQCRVWRNQIEKCYYRSQPIAGIDPKTDLHSQPLLKTNVAVGLWPVAEVGSAEIFVTKLANEKTN